MPCLPLDCATKVAQSQIPRSACYLGPTKGLHRGPAWDCPNTAGSLRCSGGVLMTRTLAERQTGVSRDERDAAPRLLEQLRERALLRLTPITSQLRQEPPRLDAVRALVSCLYECVDDVNRTAGLPAHVRFVVSGSVLHSAFPVFLHYRRGYPDRAPDTLCRIWADQAAVFGVLDTSSRMQAWLKSSNEPIELTDEDCESLSIFHVAVGQCLRRADRTDEARRILRRLMTSLDLSQDEVGRMFGVAGETVRRWEHGSTPVPAKRLAALTSAEAALDQLAELFQPERLPLVIRRSAQLFDGESALDWILRGRIQEVADRYDRVLSYQA